MRQGSFNSARMRHNSEGFLVNAPASVLAADLVRKWGVVRLPAAGTSMVPTIHPGDELCVQRTDLKKIRPGNIVVYARQGRLIVHRVVAVGPDRARQPYLVTRGDRSPRNDLPVISSEVLGLVTTLVRDHRYYWLRARLNGAERVLARFLCSSDRATYIYLRASALRRKCGFRWTICRR